MMRYIEKSQPGPPELLHFCKDARDRAKWDDFRDKAPVTPAQAATIILDGVRNEQWRILVGEDAHALDRLVREQPEMAYELSFLGQLQAAGHFNELIPPVPNAEPASDAADRS